MVPQSEEGHRAYLEALRACAARLPSLRVLNVPGPLPPLKALPEPYEVALEPSASWVEKASELARQGHQVVVHGAAASLAVEAWLQLRQLADWADLSILLVGFRPGLAGAGLPPEAQALEDIALMRLLPPVQILTPADYEELVAALPVVLESGGPCYLRYVDAAPPCTHESGFRLARTEFFGPEDPEVLLLSYGAMLREVLAAAEQLRGQGTAAAVLHLSSLQPWDEQSVDALARRARLVVSIDDHLSSGGLHSMVAELLGQQASSTPLVSLALSHRPLPGEDMEEALELQSLGAEQIAQRVRRALHRLQAMKAEPKAMTNLFLQRNEP